MCTGSPSTSYTYSDRKQSPCLSQSNDRGATDCEPTSPFLDLLYDANALEQEETDTDVSEVPKVPMSSSPPNFTSSSPCSHGSAESASEEEKSTSGSSFSNTSPESTADLSTSDGFGRKLHQLLLVVLQERELRDRTESFLHSDSSLSQTPEISAAPCFTKSKDQEETCSIEIAPRDESDISPIFFEHSQSLSSLQKSMPDERSSIHSKYRIIKRALSNVLTESNGEPLSKRQKHGRDASIHAHERIYAHRTASIRRAESLKFIDNDSQQTPLVPTLPSTPVPTGKNDKSADCLTTPVPIIAPPENHIAKLPMSSETFAKLCLKRLLQREADGRKADGLPAGIASRPPSCMLPNCSEGSLFEEHGETSIEDDIRFDWEVFIGLGSKRRKTIVAWLLQVLPAKLNSTEAPLSPSPPSSLLSSGSTSRSSLSTDSSYFGTGDDLYDQLHNSAETRFHAVWMFLRFFFLTMPPDMQTQFDNTGTPTGRIGHTSRVLEQQGLGLISWDMAVACLSLSVKFHRDFLNPLVPVYAHEYVTLAPHTLTHEDLEAAHRDILSAFDYRLGITPQSVMDQLWLALPSLRLLLDFEGGWKKTISTTWSYLFNFLRESDVQRFPISILTAVALMDGILDCLTHRYRCEFFSSDMYAVNVPDDSLDEEAFNTQAIYAECKNRTKEDTEGVFSDIQALIGVTDVYKSTRYLHGLF